MNKRNMSAFFRKVMNRLGDDKLTEIKIIFFKTSFTPVILYNSTKSEQTDLPMFLFSLCPFLVKIVTATSL